MDEIETNMDETETNRILGKFKSFFPLVKHGYVLLLYVLL